MQTINLDLSVRSIIPLLHAKQGDVGRKFKAILTDGGAAYPVPAGAAVSVWYSGASGEGNYTDIGADSAVSVSGNEITVELITQMLANYGEGKLCLAINTADGDQIGTWNIPYMVEPLPGMGSAAAQQYFTAFSQAVENLPYPDASLSLVGKAADAGAVGAALAGKAPAGFGLGETSPRDIDGNDANNAVRTGVYWISTTTANIPTNAWLGIMDVKARSDDACIQTIYYFADNATHIYTRNKNNGVFYEWQNRGASAFAPAGYEYFDSGNDYDTFMSIIANRISQMPANSVDRIAVWYYETSLITLSKNNKYTTIEEFTQAYAIGYSTYYYKRVCVYRDGAFYDWEWVNPPMKAGVEYRTTERYTGKPVYTRLLELGTFSYSEETNMTPDGIDFGGTVIDYYGYIAKSGQFRALPFPMMDVWVSTGNITVIPNGLGDYYTGWKLYLVVKTVKD